MTTSICVLQGGLYVTDNSAYTWKAAVQETVDATLNRTVSSGRPPGNILGLQCCPSCLPALRTLLLHEGRVHAGIPRLPLWHVLWCSRLWCSLQPAMQPPCLHPALTQWHPLQGGVRLCNHDSPVLAAWVLTPPVAMPVQASAGPATMRGRSARSRGRRRATTLLSRPGATSTSPGSRDRPSGSRTTGGWRAQRCCMLLLLAECRQSLQTNCSQQTLVPCPLCIPC